MKPTFAFLWVLTFALTGCALTTDTISLEYNSQTHAAKIPGAEQAAVSVDLFDVRKMKDRVSVKKNGYGMEMAPTVAENRVSALVTKALESELIGRGFILRERSARLFVELQKFYNDFKIGFWSGTAEAEVVINTQVKTTEGEIVYSKLVVGSGQVPGIQLMTGENAKVALERALADAIAQLFSDNGLIGAIFKASSRATDVTLNPALLH
jgi:uncharacterized lipoprotein YajG